VLSHRSYEKKTGCDSVKRLLVVVCSMILVMIPGFCHAEALQEYEDAYKIYIAAGASAAAYSDRIGVLAKGYLEREGWEIDHYVQKKGHGGARFLLAKKGFGDGKLTYVLAFVGTETTKDLNFDLKVDKVYFAGNSATEFTTNAKRKGVPPSQPQVHRGFHEFLEAGLTAKTLGTNGAPFLLTDILLGNKDSKLYLVGHSLGGAAATLAGAGFINMGIKSEQVEVITFGAPAVGNAAFATQLDPVLKLTRIVISGDPVTGVFQTLVGGYQQFGEERLWAVRDDSDQRHRITEYMDIALKNYYDKRQQAMLAGIQLPTPAIIGHESGQQVYIAPLQNSLPAALSKEFWYMHQALGDEYRQRLPGCTMAKEDERDGWRKTAAASGYRWVVVPEVSVTQLKQEHNIYHITFTQTVYEAATGAITATATFSTGTYNLTPLEAFIHDLIGLNNNQSPWALNVK